MPLNIEISDEYRITSDSIQTSYNEGTSLIQRFRQHMINARQKHAKNGALEVLRKVTQANELIARQNVFESERN
ncbi:hypothetical protein [Lysinibacillus sp. RC79]|uniref:hypothetical protein n=1 Tax=Lysinibacillus sp. RC79 TaxID=3156296 RepID=UPI003517FAEB